MPTPSRWMEDHLAVLGNRTLKQLVLPASHDSAMYQSGFPQSLARTQSLTIYGQLSAGIRYFDLRPRCVEGSIFIFHGPVTGPPLAEVLSDVHQYMSQGHRELVLLKFSHYDGLSDANYRAMIAQIKASLHPWIYRSLPSGKRLADVTLSEYLQSTGKILLLCDGNFPVNNPSDGVWIYRDWNSDHPEHGDLCVYDQYSNTVSFNTMKQDQIHKFNDFDGKCKTRPGSPCDLFLLSWTLTPPTGALAYSSKANSHLYDALSEMKVPNRFGCRINVLSVDGADEAVTNAAITPNLLPAIH